MSAKSEAILKRGFKVFIFQFAEKLLRSDKAIYRVERPISNFPLFAGICVDDCDLAGTIKLVGGTKWVPELLDPNTKEYQLLSNSVQGEVNLTQKAALLSPIVLLFAAREHLQQFPDAEEVVPKNPH